MKRAAVLLPILLAVMAAGFVLFQRKPGAFWKLPAVSPSEPLPMPAGGKPDHRFHRFSAWQAVEIPQAEIFESPMGSETGALVYNAQKFWEMNRKRGGHHTGDDLNGIGGMNTDLGDPVFAVADGIVLYAAEPSHGWGKIIVLGHRAPDGRLLQSMYAHLDAIAVQRGALVARGRKIGTVGTGNGNYPAHLHFEMRSSSGLDLGSGYAMFPFTHLDPAATVNDFRFRPPEKSGRPPLDIVLSETR